MAAQPVIKFTWEDYRTAPPDKRYELLDGDLLMTPAPNLKHQDVQYRLGHQLATFVDRQELGNVYFAPCDVVLTDHDVVQPDLLFVSRARRRLLANGDNVQGAPDLMIEILSPTTASRDLGYKRGLYARHGVAEYWTVDPEHETVRVLRNREEAPDADRTVGRDGILRSPLLPGFEPDLRKVFPPIQNRDDA